MYIYIYVYPTIQLMGLIKQLRTGEPHVVSFFMVKLVKHLNPTFLVDHLFTVPSTIICLGNAKWFLCSPFKIGTV